MSDLSYAEILRQNRTLGESLQSTPYRIGVLSNITVNPIVDILEYSLRVAGINARVEMGEYDNIVQDSSRFADMDAVVVFWELGNIIEGLHANHYSMAPEAVTQLMQRVEAEIGLVFSALSRVPLVLFNRFSALPFCAHELRDTNLSHMQVRLNRILSGKVPGNVTPIDIDKVICHVGLAASLDYRQFLAAKSLYSIAWLRAYIDYVSPLFRAVAGKARKVLVLDCDNTLWGGILGEDGAEKLQMNDLSRPGKVFQEVQQIIKGMRSEGVVLALCSKNNPEDVDEILDTHPDLVLRRSDFVARKINWRDKASNLRELAAELNLGLDSFVFVDDSGFEIGLVAEELPEVHLLQVPEQLSEFPGAMRRLRNLFFSLSQSDEDTQKTELYRAESERNTAKQAYENIDDYLRSLGLEVKLMWDERVPVERVAQLTQKTNQFNLTTRRHTEGDIENFISDTKHTVGSFSVRDRFGDYGVTGVLILTFNIDRSQANIDSMLMSCRVLGRNIEYAVFDALVDSLKQRGVRLLTAEYRRTAKNSQVSNLFEKLGMRVEIDSADRKAYALDLRDYQARKLDYVEVSTDVG
jgi:FkbH-like protein